MGRDFLSFRDTDTRRSVGGPRLPGGTGDLATPPHTSAVRGALGAKLPILEVTTELRPVLGPEGIKARRLPTLGLRKDRDKIEPLPDGALDPRRP